MTEICCNCKHYLEIGEVPIFDSYCELDGSYIGYVRSMVHKCEHWEEAQHDSN